MKNNAFLESYLLVALVFLCLSGSNALPTNNAQEKPPQTGVLTNGTTNTIEDTILHTVKHRNVFKLVPTGSKYFTIQN